MTGKDVAHRLETKYPIVQGPFGGGLSTATLAATVSNLGGLGSYGAHNLAPEEIGGVATAIRSLTSNPFALNLWISDHDPGGLEMDPGQYEQVIRLLLPYFSELDLEPPPPPRSFTHRFEDQMEALLAARPPVFSFVFGIPSPRLLAECRRLHIVTIGAATSTAEAQALEAAGVDLIVATGFEAGGHRPSFLARAEDSLMGTFVLTQLVSRRVRTPVIAAGGIADRTAMDAALMLGAQGVQVGTAFLACDESAASPEHRAALFSESAGHTTLTRVYTGRLARGIRNRLSEELAPHVHELPPFPIQSWLAAQLKKAAMQAGRSDLLSLWSGQIAPNLKHRTAAALMQSLVAESSTRSVHRRSMQ